MKRKHLIWAASITSATLALLGLCLGLGWVEFFSPVWLLALLLLPLFFWLPWRGISGLPPHMNMGALGLRLVVFICLTLALADLRLVLRNDALCVFFVLDQSASIPEGIVQQQLEYARRASQTKESDDRTGLLVFGTNASVEAIAERELQVSAIQSGIDRDYTNIEDALRLAMAAFPQDTRRKLVLMSDGNENLGNMLEGVRHAVGNGAELAILPVHYDYTSEVLIEKVYVPEQIKRRESFDLKVHISSLTRNGGMLTIYRNGTPIAEQEVELEPGTNTFTIAQKLDEPGFFDYSARIRPRSDQIPQNNEGRGFVYIQGESRILLVAPTALEAQFLAAACRSENLEADIVQPSSMPTSLGELQNYDCVILCNVSAGEIPQGLEQMRMLRSAVRDLGIGLIMVGGSNSFGAGDYHQTPIEDALPVSMDLKQKKVIPKGAMVLILHTCEFPDGNYWAKEISKQAINTINPQDEAGLLLYDYQNQESWLFELQTAENKQKMYRMIDGAVPGDMPSFGPPFEMAYRALADSDAMVRHIILISDGDPASPADAVIANMAAANITCSTIGINPHTMRDVQQLETIAQRTGGQYYFANNPQELPQIFIKEAKVVKRALIFNEVFQPTLIISTELTKGMRPEELPPLKAYVATSAKQRAMVPIVSDNENHDPVLAYWQFGLGRTVAFTSDATANWAEYWLEWDKFEKFWGQIVRWSARKREQSNLEISTQIEGNRGRLIIDAVDESGQFINFLELQARLVDPDYAGELLEIRQTAPGRYEAEFEAQKVGTNLLNIAYKDPQTGAQGFLTSGVAVPYPLEYQQLRTNSALLRRAAALADGELLTGDPAIDLVYESDQPPVRAFQGIWKWLIIAAILLFFVDVFVRRVIITREDFAFAWGKVAESFGRRPRVRERDQTMGALLERKKQVFAKREGGQPTAFKEQLDAAAASEIQPEFAARAETADDEKTRPSAPKAEPPADSASSRESAGDYTGRLLAAKRRAREKRQENDDSK